MMAGGFAALLLIQVPFDPSGRWLLFSFGYLGYFFVQEWIWSTTLGKLLFGLRIVHLDGRPAGLWAAGWRTLLRLFEVNPFLLGYLPGGLAIVRSKRRQRVGDMIAETVVVRRSALEPAPEPTPPQPPSRIVAESPAKPKPEALPGWLQIFLLLQVAAIVANILAIAQGNELLESHIFEFLSRGVPAFEWIVLGELLMNAVYVAVSVVGVVLTVKRSSHAPLLWRALLTFVLVASFIDWLAVQAIEPAFRFHMNSETFLQLRSELRKAQIWGVVRFVVTFLCLFFWLDPKRVANTFSRGTTTPAISTPPQTSAPADPFRGRPTIQCPHCGTQVLATAEFCRSCKQSLSDGTSGPS
jgi:uncharacterized RDD family membrane protein YckC